MMLYAKLLTSERASESRLGRERPDVKVRPVGEIEVAPEGDGAGLAVDTSDDRNVRLGVCREHVGCNLLGRRRHGVESSREERRGLVDMGRSASRSSSFHRL